MGFMVRLQEVNLMSDDRKDLVGGIVILSYVSSVYGIWIAHLLNIL